MSQHLDATPSSTLLEMRGIHKSFYGVQVLQDVNLNLAAGEVLALLGENGAGKSTLIKILNGDYSLDAGQIFRDDQPVVFAAPHDAEASGISMIYQELHYSPNLSVAENLFVGHLPRAKGPLGRWLINWQQVTTQARDALALLDVSLNPATPMRELSVVERQIVEIVKALYADAKILVMDEPTAALTPPEVAVLFDIVRRLRQKGVGIIYISHRLDEIFEIADTVMVLRDGEHVATQAITEVSPDSLVQLMVGRAVGERQITTNQHQDVAENVRPAALEVHNFSKPGAFDDITFTVDTGEVVSIFGLLGSGQIPLTRSIFGAEQGHSGQLRVAGKDVEIRKPQDAKRAGIGFVPVDRKVRGLVLGMSVRKNLTLSNWQALSQMSFFNPHRERAHSKHWINALGIRMAGGMNAPVRLLSGGNQQKVVLARWLEANANILILNEPTWGVDVGARADIYDQLERLAADGLAILIVSSDISEVLALSHRILTIYKGRLTAEFSHQQASKDKVLAAAGGAA
ncbi:MAG: sugar ABC transporter ATP-binding protein [Deinococcota bacterium]